MKLKLNSLRLPSLIALKTFEAAARHTSFRQAAEELHVTLGAVSRQISGLEKELGVTLFTRKANAVFLNDTGKRLSVKVTRAFAILKQAADEARPAGQSSLRLTCTMGLASHWLAHRLTELQKHDKPITLIIDASENIRDLDIREADIAIRYCPVGASTANSRLLLADDFFPMISPALLPDGVPMASTADLLSFRLIDSPWAGKTGRGIPSWRDWFATFTVLPCQTVNTVSYNSVGNALQEAINGKGIVLGSKAIAYDALKNGDVMAVFGPDYHLLADHEFRVMWPKGVINDEIKSWINLLLASAGQKAVANFC